MVRKLAIAVLSTALISGGLGIAPAAAAKISNGVACSKLGATTTVSGYKYQCAKNTLVKNSKLTWLSKDCVTALKQYSTALKARSTTANTANQLEVLEVRYEKAVADLATATTALDNARAQLTKFRAEMNSTTSTADKSSLTTAVSKLAASVLALSGAKTKLSTQVADLEEQRDLIASAPEVIQENISESKTFAQILCKKGR
jgi:chromosome segregation ATPase